MSLKVYIDTNIFLDAILARDLGVAKEVLYFLEEKNFEIILNDISIINIHYFAKKGLSPKDLKEYMSAFLDEYVIVSADANLLKLALNSDFSDFEDAVQYYCAKESGADFIITNDNKGFKNSEIETISASSFYHQYIL